MSRPNARQLMIELGSQLADEDNEASQLWSWLPSHAVAERHHGDYATSFTPDIREILIESNLYIRHLRRPDEPLDDEQREWFERCPCGEPHDADAGDDEGADGQ